MCVVSSLVLCSSFLSAARHNDLHVLDVMQGGFHLLLEQFVFVSLRGKVVWKDYWLEGDHNAHASHRAKLQLAVRERDEYARVTHRTTRLQSPCTEVVRLLTNTLLTTLGVLGSHFSTG